MPLQATSGAASYDAFGGGVAAVPNYIEDVFSTWLYTGNGTGSAPSGTAQTITNGVDLAGKGGLVWIKNRSSTRPHGLYDTSRGAYQYLTTSGGGSPGTGAQLNFNPGGVSAFNSNGFTVFDDSSSTYAVNGSGLTYASWTFREAPKFFDVVTYTGTGSARTVAHNLGSVPGCMIVKRLDDETDWTVYHRSLGATQRLFLNGTQAALDGTASWNSTEPTSTNFSLGASSAVNGSGGTFVAYLFAHNAGGFGLTGTDNVISCGSFTTDGSGAATVSLGYEPQWFLFKRTDDTSNWRILDVMRGGSLTQSNPLIPNTSAAESSFGSFWNPTATGFNIINQTASSTWIYIAIRRGPMKTPTTGTSVFLPSTYVGSNSVNQVINTSFTVDMTWARARNATVSMEDYDRLRGNTVRLSTDSTDAEVSATALFFDLSNSVSLIAGNNLNYSTLNFIAYNFRRAPGFFDEVCYTGDGSATRSINHNLGVPPELAIFKSRSVSGNSWVVVQKDVCTSPNQLLVLNDTIALVTTGNIFSSTGGFAAASTATTLNNIGSSGAINGSGNTQVAYLFASCPGVSKVGSYTGTGTTQTINCGFTSGARFVMIKRTDSTGDWYVWDSARGIVAGNDPYLLLNSTAAEVTSNDTIDTNSTGFVVNQVSATNVNVSSATYIFLAIA